MFEEIWFSEIYWLLDWEIFEWVLDFVVMGGYVLCSYE